MATTATQIKEMQKELDKYKSGNTTNVKDLLRSMKEISAWLKEKQEK